MNSVNVINRSSLARKLVSQYPSLHQQFTRACASSPNPDSNSSPSTDSSSSKSPPKRSRYEGYYVDNTDNPSSSSSSSKQNTNSSSSNSNKDNKDNNNSNWDRLLPYVLGGGVLAGYMWFARRSARDTSSTNSPSSPSPSTSTGSQQQPQLSDGGEVSWKTFRQDGLATRKVSKIEVVNSQIANVYFRDDHFRPKMRFNIGSIETFERKLEQSQTDLGIEPHDYVPVVYTEDAALSKLLFDWIPTLGFVAMYALLARRMSSGGGLGGLGGGGSSASNASKRSSSSPFSGFGRFGSGAGGSGGVGGGAGGGAGGPGGIFNVGKANPTITNSETSKVDITFKDVAGLTEAKEEIMEFVQYLKKPEKYKELGAKIPKGALMHGPPGTGKTLLAKATAGEAGVPFLTMSGSDFMEMFVGVGPSRVRDLFSQARSMAPCIIFLDEIDAIGRKRGRGGFVGGNDERENTLNQLLVEMDGFANNSGVVVLGGTNRVDVLDPALLRPGRFDRQIVIDAPDIAGRRDIFNVHLKKIKVSDPPGRAEVAKMLATRTPGFAGADIANVCNEAALIAARSRKTSVELEDFEASIDRVIGGLEKKNLVMSPTEKRTVAFHEAGHAVAGWFLKHAMPLLKVSIIPRGSAALGYAQYQPLEKYLMSKEALQDQMCMTLAGRASEEIFFDMNSVTTGASDDFNKVTRMAYQSVAEWGLGDTIGNLAFPAPEGGGGGDDGSGFYRPYSDRTARRIDEEVRDMVMNAYKRTKDLLEEKKDDVEKVALLLLEREAIGADDMTALLGKRPFGSSELRTFDDILDDADKSELSEFIEEEMGNGNDDDTAKENGNDGEATKESKTDESK